MAGSFFAFVDDIAVLARAAASSVDDIVAGASQASAKATGVVIDDAAVTPQYVHGITPKRELPVVWRITRGSLLNKSIIIAAILPLSVFLPQILPWLLILGGSYLAFEGAEKVRHWLRSRGEPPADPQDVAERSDADEDQIVRAALRTDIVLSAEIMLISLGAIDATGWLVELAILVVVAILMTVGVYGVVGMLIKVDDVGGWLIRRRARVAKRLGAFLVRAMPWVFRVITVIGVVAMLWIGGQILIENSAEVGFTAPRALHEQLIHAVPGPDAFGWIAGTATSAAVGLAWGTVIDEAVRLVSLVRGRRSPAR